MLLAFVLLGLAGHDYAIKSSSVDRFALSIISEMILGCKSQKKYDSSSNRLNRDTARADYKQRV